MCVRVCVRVCVSVCTSAIYVHTSGTGSTVGVGGRGGGFSILSRKRRGLAIMLAIRPTDRQTDRQTGTDVDREESLIHTTTFVLYIRTYIHTHTHTHNELTFLLLLADGLVLLVQLLHQSLLLPSLVAHHLLTSTGSREPGTRGTAESKHSNT